MCGETKRSLAIEISELTEEAGVVAKREPATIFTKIQEIVTSYQDADQHNRTYDQRKMENEVYGTCRYYDLA